VSPFSPETALRRVPFRRRLVLSQGLVLAVAFAIIGTLGWLGTYGWLQYNAWTLLEREAEEIGFHIVGLDGELAPERYAWYEPHHLYLEARVDPFFAQVFDSTGTLAFASGNTRLFASRFPDSLFAREGASLGFFSPLRTVRIDDRALYFGRYPVRGREDRTIGYLQIGRYEPGIPARLQDIAIWLSVGLVGLLIVLLVLTDRVASRTLQPLRSIMREADALSPGRLDDRIPMPADADWETARLTETLNALLGRLEGSFENMRRFTANAAHELQTPLTVLRGLVDVTLRRPRAPESYVETLGTLGVEIDRMSRTIRSLLTLARLERDRARIDDGLFDCSALLDEESGPFARRAAEKGLEWTERLDRGGHHVAGHADLMREAIRNVLENAIKYTNAGRIEVVTEVNATHVVLTVQDTGIGIAEEALPFVRERFYRAETSDAYGSGSGLGLSLVDQIAAVHGGALDITSVPQVGTTVRIRLPLAGGATSTD
jgi:signal transduction histidine kinase